MKCAKDSCPMQLVFDEDLEINSLKGDYTR